MNNTESLLRVGLLRLQSFRVFAFTKFTRLSFGTDKEWKKRSKPAWLGAIHSRMFCIVSNLAV